MLWSKNWPLYVGTLLHPHLSRLPIHPSTFPEGLAYAQKLSSPAPLLGSTPQALSVAVTAAQVSFPQLQAHIEAPPPGGV